MPQPTDPTPEQLLRAEYDSGPMLPDESDGPGLVATTSQRPAPRDPAPSPAPAAPPRHNKFVVESALDLGLRQDQIDRADPDELAHFVHTNLRQLVADRRNASLQDAVHRDAKRVSPDARTNEPPPEEEFQFDHEIEAEDEAGNRVRRPAKEKDYDPGIMKLLKEQRKAIKEFGSALQEFRQAAAADKARARDEAIDAAFESLDPAVKKLVGTGPDVKNKKSSPEFRRRLAIMGIAGCDFNNDSPQALRDKINKGAAELFGLTPAAAPAPGGAYDEVPDEPETPAAPPRVTGGAQNAPRQVPPQDPKTGRFVKAEAPADEDEEVQARRSAWAQAGLGKPTQRHARELPKGEGKAAQTADRMLREMFPEAVFDMPVGYEAG